MGALSNAKLVLWKTTEIRYKFKVLQEFVAEGGFSSSLVMKCSKKKKKVGDQTLSLSKFDIKRISLSGSLRLMVNRCHKNVQWNHNFETQKHVDVVHSFGNGRRFNADFAFELL